MESPDKKNTETNQTSGSPEQSHQAERVAADAAHDQASHDIDEDPDFSMQSPNDDLDEGETARLGEGENPLI